MSDKFLSPLCASLVAGLLSSTALAQAAPAPAPAPAAAPVAPASVPGSDPSATPEIVVTGLRGSLQNAARIKRDSPQIQDSIVAEDIGKLPDTNIAETLQRIPGVQISRNTRGEGNAYEVHGLSQVMSTVNGRTLFSTTDRVAHLLDFSADILSGLDVYKTATADQIEGGLGGLINIHMARPFDFQGSHFAATASGNFSEIHHSVTPRLSGIASDRWDTGIGEIGVLVGMQWEQVDSGGYQTTTNTYTPRTDIIPGQTVEVPAHVTSQYEYGNRRRATIYSALQWKPSDTLSFYVDGLYSYSGGHSQTQDFIVRNEGATTGAVNLKNGSDVPSSITYNNATVQSVTGSYDNPYRTYDVAVGGSYTSGGLKVSSEFSYERSAGPFYDHTLTLQGTAPSATIGLNGKTPSMSVSGFDPASPAGYAYGGFFDLANEARGTEPVIRGDVKYEFASGPIKALLAGVRYSDHDAVYDVYSNSYSPSNSGLTQPIGDITTTSPGDLFRGRNASLNQWLVLDWKYIKNLEAARTLVGLPTGDPAFPPLNHYDYHEKVLAGYVESQFGFDVGRLPIDGNVGVRIVNTKGRQDSFETDASTGGVVPVSGGGSYTNVLPSLNIRAKFTPDLFLRFAYSKAIARPEYGDLSPALVLNPASGTGSGGNPGLGPIKADQYDLSLEYYFGRSNLIAASLFKKDVNGFIQNFGEDETIGGISYLISRPRNSGTGTIKGAEVNYQQFFDFLPGLLSGLGMQGNFTYVDSRISVLGSDVKVPAEGLSKYSYNLTGIYEKGPVSLHLSYNWRSKSVVTTDSGDSQHRPVIAAPINSLDLSLTYALTRNIQLKFDAVNMLYSFQDQYYGSPAYVHLANQLDRSFEAGVHVSF